MSKALFSLVLVTCLAVSQDVGLPLAEQLYHQTDYRKALDLLQPDKSKDPRVLALAGKSYYMLGEFKKASEWFQRAIRLEPNSSQYHHWLGRAYGRRAETSSFLTAPGYASSCRKAFEKAVELDPANVEAMNDLLEYYLEAPGILGGGMDKAVAMAQRIGELDPVEKHFAQARLAEKREEFPTAEKHLRVAAELAPTQVGRIIDLAKFLARHGKVQESEMVFRRAEKIAPDHPKLLFERAQVYIEGKRNLEVARQLLERYLRVTLTPDDPPRQEAEKLLRQVSGS